MSVARIALFAGAGLLGCALVLLLAGQTESPPAAPAASAPAAPVRTESPAPSRSPSLATSPAAVAPSAAMRARFDSATNYAAFIQDAMQRPTEGGLFYADLAFQRCQEITAMEARPDAPLVGSVELRAVAMKGIADLKQRCSGVKAQFPDDVAFIRAIKQANARGVRDLLLPEGGVRMALSPDNARRDFERALASGDPYLIAISLEVNVDYLAGSLDPAFVKEENGEVLHLAAGAAACELLDLCKNSFLVQGPCMAAGQCARDDYRDYQADGLDPAALALYHRTRKKLVQIGRGAVP